MKFYVWTATLFVFVCLHRPSLANKQVVSVRIELEVPTNRSAEEILRLRGLGWEDPEHTAVAYQGTLVLKTGGEAYLSLDNLYKIDSLYRTRKKTDLRHLGPPDGILKIPTEVAKNIFQLRNRGAGSLWHITGNKWRSDVAKFVSLNSLELDLKLEHSGIKFRDASVQFFTSSNDFRFPIYLQTWNTEISLSSSKLTPFSLSDLSEQRFGIALGNIQSGTVIFSENGGRILQTPDGPRTGLVVPRRSLVGVKILPMTKDVSLALFGTDNELIERRNLTNRPVILVTVRNHDLQIARSLEEYELWSASSVDTEGVGDFVWRELEFWDHGSFHVTPIIISVPPGVRDSRPLSEIIQSLIPNSIVINAEQLQMQSEAHLKEAQDSHTKRFEGLPLPERLSLQLLIRRCSSFLVGLIGYKRQSD